MISLLILSPPYKDKSYFLIYFQLVRYFVRYFVLATGDRRPFLHPLPILGVTIPNRRLGKTHTRTDRLTDGRTDRLTDGRTKLADGQTD